MSAFGTKADIAKNSDLTWIKFKVLLHELSSMKYWPTAKQEPVTVAAEQLPPPSPGSTVAASRPGRLHAGVQGPS
jgi:hypothetical protein